MNTKIGVMEPTCTLKSIFNKARSEPFSTFINYPIEEIRDTCIEGIKNYHNIGSGFADQTEAIIKRLKLVDWQNDYWKKILEWYLFAAEDEPVLKRAIEFAISLYDEDPVLYDNMVSKLLAGRLKKGFLSIEFYDKIPALKAFFHGLFRGIYLNKWTRKLRFEYSGSDWYIAHRVLDIAVQAEDFSLLCKIEEMIMLIEEGALSPNRDSHWGARETHLALMKSAEKLLEKAKCRAAKGE